MGITSRGIMEGLTEDLTGFFEGEGTGEMSIAISSRVLVGTRSEGAVLGPSWMKLARDGTAGPNLSPPPVLDGS